MSNLRSREVANAARREAWNIGLSEPLVVLMRKRN
jgi:hypothetical protein